VVRAYAPVLDLRDVSNAAYERGFVDEFSIASDEAAALVPAPTHHAPTVDGGAAIVRSREDRLGLVLTVQGQAWRLVGPLGTATRQLDAAEFGYGRLTRGRRPAPGDGGQRKKE
jgi:hypothetical protein